MNNDSSLGARFRMAHLPPANAAIFSPSRARAAASVAKDWNFVDAWLASRFHGQAPPSFERNPDTLRALLALVALNESADEDRDLLARAEARALRDADAADHERFRRAEERNAEGDSSQRASRDRRETPRSSGHGGNDSDETSFPPLADIRQEVLDALEESLPREGRATLDATAGAAVELGIAYPDAEAVGRAMVDLQGRIDELERAGERVGALRRHVDAESERLRVLAEEVRGDDYRPPPDLAKTNLETQRSLKAMAAKLPELRDRAASLAASVGTPSPTVGQVREDEEEYLALLARRMELDAQVKTFCGLPPDTDAARRELEGLRGELRQIAQRRDAVFEGLVERETPKKPRR